MKDSYLTKIRCFQAGLQPVELGSGGEEEAALEAASGVESTNSEVSLIMMLTWPAKSVCLGSQDSSQKKSTS